MCIMDKYKQYNCYNCSNRVEYEDLYCSNCGKRLNPSHSIRKQKLRKISLYIVMIVIFFILYDYS